MSTYSNLRRIAFFGIMLLMLFIVLSTATYAWYSANNVATVDNVVFTSSASDTEGGLLAIGTDLSDTSTNLTFDSPSEFFPMIPIDEAVVGQTTYAEFVGGFNKTSEGLREGLNGIAEWVAKLDGTAITPLTLTSGEKAYFYVINRSPDDNFNVKIDYAFDDDAEPGEGLKDKLHIAFFLGEGNDATLLGIATTSRVHYGAIQAGDVIDETAVMDTAVEKVSGEMAFRLDHGEHAKIRLVVWLDGVDMKNKHGSKNMLFSLNFRGEAV